MVTIDVDFEVFKELTVRRRSEAMTENEVIRELLRLSQSTTQEKIRLPENSAGTPWVAKGLVFPHGTEFRAAYKGRQHTGTVQNGALVVNGRRFSSPSAAAVAITRNPVNGWMFWECLMPGSTKWKTIAELRK